MSTRGEGTARCLHFTTIELLLQALPLYGRQQRRTATPFLRLIGVQGCRQATVHGTVHSTTTVIAGVATTTTTGSIWATAHSDDSRTTTNIRQRRSTAVSR